MPWSPASAGYLWKAFPMLCSSRPGTVSFCRVGCPSASRPICHSRLSTSALSRSAEERRCAHNHEGGEHYIVGGHFALTGSHADILLKSLPPIVHIRKESDKAAMRWSLERMKEELRDPQPGGSLIAQQLAYMMLIQALRLHLADGEGGVGWLFALADKQMSAAITCMHDDPGIAGHCRSWRSASACRDRSLL
jgi:hypothetical protein